MIIPTGFAQVNYVFLGGAVPTGAEITLGLFVDVFAGDPEDAAIACTNAWGTSGMQDLYTNDASVRSVNVKFGPNDTGPSFERPTDLPGSAASPTSPPNVSTLVKKVTSAGGRTGRGRFFVPAVPEGDVSQGGEMSAGWITAANLALSDFYAKLVADDLTPALLHSANSPVQQPLPLISFVADARAATQRRRLRR